MKQLLEAGVHFGHQTSRWNPKMRPYIFGARNGIHIIDLQQTVTLFRQACDFVREVVANGGTVLFVGTKKQAHGAVQNEAARCGQMFVNNRWLGGTLTNFQTIKQSIERLKNLEEVLTEENESGFNKKELLFMQRDVNKLRFNLDGIRAMKKLPDVVFVIDPDRESIAVHEANRLNIPVVAVVDTNCDPDSISYCIPGNDDAIRAIRLFCGAIADASLAGSQEFEERRREADSASGMNLSSPMLAGLDAADAPPSDAPSADGGQESAKTETETAAATDEPVAEATK
ncbi:MAG: 30S ribosomal protein S2 [Deltaproteobacteria bacterium]